MLILRFLPGSGFTALDNYEDTTSVSRSLREDLYINYNGVSSIVQRERCCMQYSVYRLQVTSQILCCKENCDELLLSTLHQYNMCLKKKSSQKPIGHKSATLVKSISHTQTYCVTVKSYTCPRVTASGKDDQVSQFLLMQCDIQWARNSILITHFNR